MASGYSSNVNPTIGMSIRGISSLLAITSKMPISFNNPNDPTNPMSSRPSKNPQTHLPMNKRFLITLDDTQEYVILLYDLNIPAIRRFVESKMSHSPISFYYLVSKVQDIYSDLQLNFKRIEIYTDDEPEAYDGGSVNQTFFENSTNSMTFSNFNIANSHPSSPNLPPNNITPAENYSAVTQVIFKSSKSLDIGHLTSIFDEPNEDLIELEPEERQTPLPLPFPSNSTTQARRSSAQSQQCVPEQQPATPSTQSMTPTKQKRASIFERFFGKSTKTDPSQPQSPSHQTSSISSTNQTPRESVGGPAFEPSNSSPKSPVKSQGPRSPGQSRTSLNSFELPPTAASEHSSEDPNRTSREHTASSFNGSSVQRKEKEPSSGNRYRIKYSVMIGKTTVVSNTTKSFKKKTQVELVKQRQSNADKLHSINSVNSSTLHTIDQSLDSPGNAHRTISGELNTNTGELNDAMISIDQVTTHTRVPLQPQPFLLDPDAFLFLPSAPNLGLDLNSNRHTQSFHETSKSDKDKEKEKDSKSSKKGQVVMTVLPSEESRDDFHDIQTIQENINSIPTSIYIHFELFQGSRLFKRNRLPIATGDFLYNITLLRNKENREKEHVIELINTETNELSAELHFSLDMVFPQFLSDLLTIRYLFKGHESNSSVGKGERAKILAASLAQLNGGKIETPQDKKRVRKSRQVRRSQAKAPSEARLKAQDNLSSIFAGLPVESHHTTKGNQEDEDPYTSESYSDFESDPEIQSDCNQSDPSATTFTDSTQDPLSLNSASQFTSPTPLTFTTPGSSLDGDALFPSIFGQNVNDICPDYDDDGNTELVHDAMIQRWLKERVVAAAPLGIDDMSYMEDPFVFSSQITPTSAPHSVGQIAPNQTTPLLSPSSKPLTPSPSETNTSSGPRGMIGLDAFSQVYNSRSRASMLGVKGGLLAQSSPTLSTQSKTPPFLDVGGSTLLDPSPLTPLSLDTLPPVPPIVESVEPESTKPNSGPHDHNSTTEQNNSLPIEAINSPINSPDTLSAPPLTITISPVDLTMPTVSDLLIHLNANITPEMFNKLDSIPKFASLDVLENEKVIVNKRILLLSQLAQLDDPASVADSNHIHLKRSVTLQLLATAPHLGHLTSDQCQERLHLLDKRIVALNDSIGTGSLSVFEYIDKCQDQILIETHLLYEAGLILDLLEEKCLEVGQLIPLLREEVLCNGDKSRSNPQNPHKHRISVQLDVSSEPITNSCNLDHNEVANSIDKLRLMTTTFSAAADTLSQLSVEYEALSTKLLPVVEWIQKRQVIVRNEIDSILEDLQGGIGTDDALAGAPLSVVHEDDCTED